VGVVGEDTWAGLADTFADQAYASVKGLVRTYVMHQQLLEHLPEPPATVLDVGGGAGHQSVPLAQAGYEVTVLDPSPAMLAKAGQRLQGLPAEAQRRVTLLQADGENADAAVDGRRFAAVLVRGLAVRRLARVQWSRAGPRAGVVPRPRPAARCPQIHRRRTTGRWLRSMLGVRVPGPPDEEDDGDHDEARDRDG